jgi:hypothetical protein
LSIRALNWAFELDLKPATRKFVLVVMSNHAGDSGLCFPATETLCRMTSLDRKTVISALDDLVQDGFLVDTGERRGKTKQVKVYQLAQPSQYREPSEDERLPFFPPKAPVFPVEGSQKRDAEPLKEPSRKKDIPATPGHSEFIKLWVDSYKVFFNRDYKFSGGKDGSAVKRLLQSTKKTPEELIEVAKTAWRFHRSKFNCKLSVTISGFDARYNDILSEIPANATARQYVAGEATL